MAARVCTASLARFAQTGLRSSAIGPLPRPTRLLQFQRSSTSRSFSARTVAFAKKYSEDHEWIELDSDGTTGVIGISQYATGSLGDVVFVELPELDLEISQGDIFGSVESTKAASDVFAPVSGKVIEVNNQLQDNPGLMNKSPEGEGWYAKLQVQDLKQLDSLMDSDAYKKFCDSLADE